LFQGGGAVYTFEPVSDFTYEELRRALIEEYTQSAVHKALMQEGVVTTSSGAEEKVLIPADTASCASDDDMAEIDTFAYVI
jgi:hypothetical protein